jgi:hypothetical protein
MDEVKFLAILCAVDHSQKPSESLSPHGTEPF